MRGRIVPIGNSRGVRIPKAMLEGAGLTGEIELRLVDGEIRISPIEPDTGAALLLLSTSALDEWSRPEEDAAWRDL